MKPNDTMGGEVMKLLTKAEACRDLRLSLSTLNRRIAAGEVPVMREPRGQRHRVYVMLDDDPPMDGGPLTRSWRWPRSGFVGWKSSLNGSGSATPSWSTS